MFVPTVSALVGREELMETAWEEGKHFLLQGNTSLRYFTIGQ